MARNERSAPLEKAAKREAEIHSLGATFAKNRLIFGWEGFSMALLASRGFAVVVLVVDAYDHRGCLDDGVGFLSYLQVEVFERSHGKR